MMKTKYGDIPKQNNIYTREEILRMCQAWYSPPIAGDYLIEYVYIKILELRDLPEHKLSSMQKDQLFFLPYIRSYLKSKDNT